MRLSFLLVALAAGLAVGLGYPYIDLALACRNPSSEACVWGKAYFSLTITVSLVLLGPIAAGLVYGMLTWLRHRRRRDRGQP